MNEMMEESIKNRIIVDAEKIKKDIQFILDELQQFRFDKKIRGALGSESIEKLHQWNIDIKKRMDDDFSIVVIGDFKRGKSTLINALLREKVVTTNVTPETVTINRVSYGENYSAEAILKDGRRAMLDINEMNREKLDHILTKLPSPVEYIDIKAPVESLKGIRIVDTPGVGDILNKFDQQVKEYMVHADAVIYVVSALSPFSVTEQTFLCASILPQNFSKLFVVLNMVDCMDTKEDVEKIKNMINNRLSDIFPNSHVYAVSSLDEYCRHKQLKRPNQELIPMLEESFDRMYGTLQRDVILQKDFIQTGRTINMVKLMTRELEARVTLIGSMLALEQGRLLSLMEQYENENSDLMKRIQQHKESVGLEIREMHSEAKLWMEEFLERLQEEIKRAESQPMEVLEKHLHFYMIDTVRAAIMECTNTHLRSLTKILQSASQAFAQEFASMTFSASSAKIAGSMVDVSWTNIDTAAVALSFFPGLGALALLGQAVLGFYKQNSSGEQKQKYILSVLSNYPQIQDSILHELRSVYEYIVLFAEQQLDKIYEQQIIASIEIIKNARELSMGEEADKAGVKIGLESAQQILDAVKDKLEIL